MLPRALLQTPWALQPLLLVLLLTPPRALLMQPLALPRKPKRRCNLRLFRQDGLGREGNLAPLFVCALRAASAA